MSFFFGIFSRIGGKVIIFFGGKVVCFNVRSFLVFRDEIVSGIFFLVYFVDGLFSLWV